MPAPTRGPFASGKFDQYKRDIPYAPLAQAFQSLIRPLLGRSDAELAIWRGAFLEALEPNARLMTDLIPRTEASSSATRRRSRSSSRSRRKVVSSSCSAGFIGVFARPNHPLALFFDDLQWLDAATLDLLEEICWDPVGAATSDIDRQPIAITRSTPRIRWLASSGS